MSFRSIYKKIWNSLPKPIRWIINRLDTPFDKFKEYLYNDGEGRRIGNYIIYFDCIMMNRTGNCRIERV